MAIYLCPNLSTPERTNAALRVIDCFENQLNERVLMSAENSLRLCGDDAHAGSPESARTAKT